MPDCGFGPKDDLRERRRLRLLATLLVLGSMAIGLMLTPAGAFATTNSGTGSDVAVENDANHDGVFGDSEIVPKNATYPWTVTYRLTLSSPRGTTPIKTLSDNLTSSPLVSAFYSPSCDSLIGSVVTA